MLSARTYAILAAILFLGAALRFYNLGEQSFWIDEGAAYQFAQDSHYELWTGEGKIKTTPPLFLSFQHLWLQLFGESEGAFRSLSACFGTLGVLMAFFLGRCLGGPRAGLFSAALIATSSFHIEYSQEARTYIALTVMAMTSMWATTYLLKHAKTAAHPLWRRTSNSEDIDPPRVRAVWLVYVLATTAALYFHNTAVVLPFTMTLAAALAWWRSPEVTRGFAVNWFVANTAILVLWSWWLPTVISQSLTVAKDFWIPDATIPYSIKTILEAYGHPHLGSIRVAAVAISLLLATYGAVRAIRTGAKGYPVALAFLTVPITVFLLSQSNSIMITRVLLWPTAALFVCLGFAVTRLRPRWLQGLVACVVLAINLKGAVGYHRFATKEPFNKVAEHIATHAQQDDALILISGQTSWAFEYYLPPGNPPLSRHTPMIDEWDRYFIPYYPHLATEMKEMAALPDQHERIWAVVRGSYRRLENEKWDQVRALYGDRVEETDYVKLANLHIIRLDRSDVPHEVSSE
jgi:4-amino-4-deoxy-L-arabinose transferase-like glycosyltransferase